jgi:C4-dicarboxylate-specific signal transduction histidine kinase
MSNLVSVTVRNLRTYREDPVVCQEALDTLETTACRMKRLIEKLCVNHAGTRLHREATPLGDLVRTAMTLLSHAGRRPEVRATTVRFVGPLWCEVDRSEMEGVLFNLLLNAYEATEAGGEVEVTGIAGPQPGQVRLVIEDTGPGIPQPYLEDCLFCPFQSTKPTGFGLGLYHARIIIEAQGGSIEVTNRERGRGARVTVTLPGSQRSITLAGVRVLPYEESYEAA